MFNHAFVTAPPVVKVTGDDGKRYYTTPQGNRYESVTTFIDRLWRKKKLYEWKARVGAKKAAEVTGRATKRGTAVHKIAETYLLNEQMDLDNPLSKSLFLKIKPAIDMLNNVRLIETSLYSDRYKLAGTPDCIADWCDPPWEANLAVVDFKTSTRKKEKKYIIHYFLQAACYGRMFEEHFGVLPSRAIIVMATEDLPQPQVFNEDMNICVKMLDNFIKDPIAFQARAGNA